MAKQKASKLFQGTAAAREDILERFERAWASGRPPALEHFVPDDGPLRSDVLVELIHTDVEWRLKTGHPAPVESYLQRFPELAEQADAVVDLILTEYRWRQRRGQAVSPAEYLRRFPSYRDQLAARLPTGAPTTTDVVDVLRAGQFLEADQLGELDRLQTLFADAKALAGALIRRGWLTPFQANLLLQGRAHELGLGTYVLLERLGEGGMGTVYKARHRGLGRIVAVKVIRKNWVADLQAIKRFQREIRAAAQLDHPNIVRAFDADEIAGNHLLVMEYVENGTDLAKIVKRDGPLPIATACDYIRQVARGLQHAHERGLVHRDIKPQNLLQALSDQRSAVNRQQPGSGKLATESGPLNATIKILDMGLARLDDTQHDATSMLTHEGAVMGTLDYIAPEQARDSHSVDIRADLYSLGCTMFYLLTGRLPFPGGSATEKLLKHQFDPPPNPLQIRPEVSAEVGAIVAKLMAKRPEDRFQTPGELAQVLEQVLAGQVTTLTSSTAAKTLSAGRVVSERQLAEQWAQVVTPASATDVLVKPPAQVAAAPQASSALRWLLVGGVAALVLFILVLWQPWRRDTAVPLLWSVFNSGHQPDAPPSEPGPDALPPNHSGRPTAPEGALDFGPPIRVAFNPKYLDALDAAKIPALDKYDWQPKELVAVFGQHRLQGIAAISPDGQLIAAYNQYQGGVQLGSSTDVRVKSFLPLDFPVSALALSSDKQTLALAASDKTVRLWDLKIAKEIGELQGHDDVPQLLAFAGNKQLVAATKKTVWLWDCAQAKVLHQFKGHKGPITDLAVSPDGTRAVTAGGEGDGELWLWGLNDKAPAHFLPSPNGYLTAVAVSPDGKQVACVDSGLVTHVWDTADLGPGKQTRSFKYPWNASVSSCAFASDGKRLLAGSSVAGILFDLVSGTVVRQVNIPAYMGPGKVALCPGQPNPRMLFIGAVMRLFDTETGTEVQSVNRWSTQMQCVTLSPDGRRVAAGSAFLAQVWSWDLATGKEFSQYVGNQVLGVAYTPDARLLGYAGQDMLAPVVLDMDTDQAVKPAPEKLKLPALDWLSSLTFSRDGHFALAGTMTHGVAVWDLRTGKVVRTLPTGKYPVAIEVALDSRTALVSGAGETHLWDINGARGLHTWPGPGLFLPDGRVLVLTTDKAVIWDVQEGKFQAHDKLPLMTARPSWLVLSKNGQRLAGVEDRPKAGVTVLDVKTGATVWQWQPPYFAVKAATLSPDGRYLLTANNNGTVYVFRLPSSKAQVPPRQTPAFRNTLGMEFVLVPEGKSWLGGGNGKPGAQEVQIDRDFYLGKYEVTQGEWQKIMGVNPSQYKGVSGSSKLPVEMVSWEECQEFIKRINDQAKEAGWVYRLPTELEWEYACRGGPMNDSAESASDFYLEKPTNTLLPDLANFAQSSHLKRTCKVGSYKPNRLGLYDMHGNVIEWTDTEEKASDGTSHRILRGGCCEHGPENCRAAFRYPRLPSFRYPCLGLRLARVPLE